MKQKLKEELVEDIEELTKLLTDRIEESYKIKGLQSQRHSFILYRNMLNDIRWKIEDAQFQFSGTIRGSTC